MSTYVIGDIQGCYREFRELLSVAGFKPGTDTLWLVGDLVNRGPDNLGVLKYLMDLDRLVTVLGNHDLHLLAVARGFAKPRGRDTIDDVLESHELESICQWLRMLPLVHREEDTRRLLVHAGVPPQWTAATCEERAAEVEQVLRGDGIDTFLAQMYGNEPARFSESLSGNDRLRVITNYFTRLRFCRADGTIELDAKGTDAPPDFAPWFTFPRDDDYTIYFGHWAAIEGHTDNPKAIALDTGCVWGGRLTALRLEDGSRFSVPARASQG